MTDADMHAIADTDIHTALEEIFANALRQAHQAVQARENVHKRAKDWEETAKHQRGRIAALEQQESEARADAALLTAIRVALGAEEDADLVEEVRRIRAESEGRRKALEQVGEERRREWERAEYAEAAAAHFYHCQVCRPGEPCPEGWAYVVALGLKGGQDAE